MIHQFLAFASDAKLLLFTGLACWTFAVFAWLAERRRGKRADLDRVGWVPWIGLFLAAVVSGTVFVMLGSKALF